MAVQITSGNDQAGKVNVTDEHELLVSTTKNFADAGTIAIVGENAPASDPHGRLVRPVEVSSDFRVRVANDALLYSRGFTSTARVSEIYEQAATLSVQYNADPARCRLNSAVSGSSGHAGISTYQYWYPGLSGGIWMEAILLWSDVSTNSFMVFGGTSVNTKAITTNALTAMEDGAWFEIGALGIRAVCAIKGVDVSSAWNNTFATGVRTRFSVGMFSDRVEWYINNTLFFTVSSSSFAGNGGIRGWANGRGYSMKAAICNVGTAIPGNYLDVHEWSVSVADYGNMFPLPLAAALSSRSSVHLQASSAAGILWTNSNDSSLATLSNIAPGYSGYTGGGKFRFNAPAGALTDYILFGVQTNGSIGVGTDLMTAVLTGVQIYTYNFGAAVATTPTVIEWFLSTANSAQSLAQTDSTTARGPRRRPLGIQYFPVGAPIGATSEMINVQFDVPIVCEPSLWYGLCCRIPVGTATGSQVIHGSAFIEGYFL